MRKYLAVLMGCIALGLGAAAVTSASTESAQRAPYACTKAIHEARVMAYLASQGFTVSAKLIPLIHDAAVAGAEGDIAAINRIASTLNISTTKLNRLAKSMSHTAGLFNGYAALCK